MDPAFARSIDNVNACRQIYDGLVEFDQEMKIRPAIAKSWEILDSGTSYKFTLRKDVYYHKSKAVFGIDSSRKVIAADFVFAFNRLIDRELLSPGKWVMNKVARKEDGKLAMEALNDSTLIFKLKEAFPPFLGILSMQYCSVVPPEAFSIEDYDFSEQPIGTGAFIFKYWKTNTKLVLLKNQQYFQRSYSGDQLPYLDALSISFKRDQEVVFLDFLKGDLDLISGLKGSYKDELLDPNGKLRDQYQEQVQFIKRPYLNTEYLGFQLGSDSISSAKVVQNRHLRKAINFGIDKAKMLRYLRNNIGIPANNGFVPPALMTDNELDYGYFFNLDSSKYYLKLFNEEVKWNAGQEPIVLATTSEYLDICEYVQHQLNSLGIKVKIEVNPAATNNEMIAFGKLPFFRKSWIADYPDPENYLSLFLSRNFSPEGPNYTHFSVSEYDQLYAEAMKLSGDSLRQVLYRKLDSSIMAHAPVVPLFYDQQVHFLSPKISQFRVNSMSHLMLKYAKKQ